MPELEDPSVKILKQLKKAGNQYVSGEELSNTLGMSRTAIWKRIDSIKEEGFNVEAVTNKGYRLIKGDDSCGIDAPYGKLAVLSEVTGLVLGQNFKFLKETDSTNTVLKKMAAKGAPEGTVVLADVQSAGRGRRGRTWMSAPKMGIWMSILLRPNLHPSSVQTLTLAASVAVMKALEPMEIEGLGIKWPNDILINQKKVCGILTELSAEAEKVDWVVLGIGLNVNHSESDFSNDIADIATSLRMNVNKNTELNRSEIAANILNEMEKVYQSFIEKGSSWVVDEWRKRNVTLGKMVDIISQTGSFRAKVLDITADGKLIVKDADNKVHEVLSGEISLREAENWNNNI